MGVCFMAIGDELLRGETREGNGAVLAEHLGGLGLRLDQMRIVGDDKAAIAAALGDLRGKPGTLMVVSGGLGPTDDDFTRQAVAEALGLLLVQSETAMAQIEERFARLGRPMHPANAAQAWLPIGARLLENKHGTAPGFLVHVRDLAVMALPGVPREFSAMIDDHLAAALAATGHVAVPRTELTYRLFGIPESEMQGALAELPHYAACTMRSLPSWPEIRLKLSSRGDADGFAALLDEFRARLGPFVYGQGDGDSHAAAVLRELLRCDARLAVAESCTGGLVSHLLTEVPGSSRTLTLGVVAYANAAKAALLDVPEVLLRDHGAVSEPVVAAMAQGALGRGGADVAVATSGIAGPDGGTPNKPVGTLCLAVADRQGVRAETVVLRGLARGRFKTLAAHLALDRLLRWARGRPPP
ncbi:MAG: CinA family nicotinamide mononucleotide deamidase-related protein [Deltaproteobacteria bacterium]|nr:CinA family nicotinamide mononucleotide deamidase-related protein [Deltaproteobacteria bacterium]